MLTKMYQRKNAKPINCKFCGKPVITYETGLADTWRKNPRPPKGWHIKPDSVYNSEDGWAGYPYQKYTLVKNE